MRNRVFGAIGVAWGGAILVWCLMAHEPMGRGAYGAGQIAGVLIAVLMLMCGLYTLAVDEDDSDRRRRDLDGTESSTGMGLSEGETAMLSDQVVRHYGSATDGPVLAGLREVN